MLILFRFCLLATFLVFTVSAAPVPKDQPKPLLYYPIQKGAKWVYQYNGGEWTCIATSVEEKGASKIVTVEKKVNDKLVPLWIISVSDKGLYEIAAGDVKLESPLPLLTLPAKPGDKWELNHTQEGLPKINGTVRVGDVETIEVPAGKYETLRLEWDYTLDGKSQQRTYWFARDIGWVKMIVKTKTDTDEVVLKKFYPGK
jgi:hypothetical protein